LGKGFIHITGKSGYKEISDAWNKLYPDDPKEFHGKDINLLETDVEVAMKASMVYWKLKNLNSKADKGFNSNAIDDVGRIINGSKNRPNGADLRIKYTQELSQSLNN
jgi:predicted chitinase